MSAHCARTCEYGTELNEVLPLQNLSPSGGDRHVKHKHIQHTRV